MAALVSGAGRRLTATRELDLTKYYFYQYPPAQQVQAGATDKSHASNSINLSGHLEDEHQVSPALSSSSPAPSSSSPNQSSSQSTPGSFSSSPSYRRHTSRSKNCRRHANESQQQSSYSKKLDELKSNSSSRGKQEEQRSTVELAISAISASCDHMLKSTATMSPYAREQHSHSTALDYRASKCGHLTLATATTATTATASEQQQSRMGFNSCPSRDMHSVAARPTKLNSSDDLSLGSCPSSSSGSGQQRLQGLCSPANDRHRIRDGNNGPQKTSLRRRAPLPPLPSCRLETRSKPDDSQAAVKLAEDTLRQQQAEEQLQRQPHNCRIISPSFAINKRADQSPLVSAGDDCYLSQAAEARPWTEGGREAEGGSRQDCYPSPLKHNPVQSSAANVCRSHLGSVHGSLRPAADAHHLIIDWDTDQQRRQKPTIEEQLKRLLDLEPLSSNKDNNCHKQLCSSPPQQHAGCQVSPVARNICAPPATHQLGAISSISNQLHNQLKLVKKPHMYHQSTRMKDPHPHHHHQLAGAQATITPADEMMMFMVASRRAAALGANSVAAKNERILKWLDDCAKSMSNTVR